MFRKMSLIAKTSVPLTLTLSEGHNCQEQFVEHYQSEENNEGSYHNAQKNQAFKLHRFVHCDLEAC